MTTNTLPNEAIQDSMNRTQAARMDQYSIWQILGIWLAGGAPMWSLAWLVYPALSRDLPAVDAGLLLMKLLMIGLVWQFVLAMIILYREEGDLRLSTIRRRFWLNNPVSPKTGQKNNRLWWLLIPLLLLNVAVELGLAPYLNEIWTRLFPLLTEPQSHSLGAMFAPEVQASWIGAWDLLAIFMVLSVFNNFLGEEFLFRGVLLPRMKGVFGRWDWVANGVAFGLYHLHMPWSLPGNILSGLLYAFAGKRYRSNWFPILLHSGQAFYFGFLILGLVLGLA